MKKLIAIILISSFVSCGTTTRKGNFHSRGYKNPTPEHTKPPRTKGGPNANSYYSK